MDEEIITTEDKKPPKGYPTWMKVLFVLLGLLALFLLVALIWPDKNLERCKELGYEEAEEEPGTSNINCIKYIQDGDQVTKQVTRLNDNPITPQVKTINST